MSEFYKLIDIDTGEEVPILSKRLTNRGEVCQVEGFAPPIRDGLNSRVYVRMESGLTATYYPLVIGCKIVAK